MNRFHKIAQKTGKTPRVLLCLLFALLMVFPLCADAREFSPMAQDAVGNSAEKTAAQHFHEGNAPAAQVHRTFAPRRVAVKKAATNPFLDVPPGSWTYEAFRSLGVASADLHPMTRYEAATLTVRLMTKAKPDQMSKADLECLKKLIVEYKDELDALGVKMDKIDQRLAVAERDLGGWSLAESGAAMDLNRYRMARPYPGAPAQPRRMQVETARYGSYQDNPVKQTLLDPYSTFGLDVSTASYANTRRFLRAGRIPPTDAVRVEEFINYFPPLEGERAAERIESSPFYAAYEMAPCPWNGANTLLWLSLTAKGLDDRAAPDANLVFLVDVSGSMNPPERLPLVRSALKMLVERLRPVDRISLVTYAGSTAVVLEATPGSEKAKILSAIDSLGAGGSTAGAAGLQLAYGQAHKGYIRGGVNRILLCTDGDFNVGISDTGELKKMVERERENGVTLSIFGFGTDNYNDEMMTAIANVGNGNYSYVDSMTEARKVLDEEMLSTLVTVAKDAKVQVEFNPAVVSQYRLIGYEKRNLANEEFADDAVDAGDVGAGRRVLILYELTPTAGGDELPQSRYRDLSAAGKNNGETAYLSLRWKQPDGAESALAGMPIRKERTAARFEDAGTGLRFSAAVAAYAQKLRQNANLQQIEWKQIEEWANGARKDDPYRAEFVQLVRLADTLARTQAEPEATPD